MPGNEASGQRDFTERIMRMMAGPMRDFHGADAPHKITPGQFRVLRFLMEEMPNHEKGVKLSSVVSHLNVTPPMVTQIVNTLEENGFVSRSIDPDDRRVIRLKVTREGAAYVEQKQEATREFLRGMTEYLGPEDSENFLRILKKMDEYMQSRRTQHEQE